MSNSPRRARASTQPRIERWQPWIAGLASVALHVLLIVLALLAPPITMSRPQGADAGSPMYVDFVGTSPPQPQQVPTPPTPLNLPRNLTPPAASRVRPTIVQQADDPLVASVPHARAPAPAAAATPPPPAPPTQARRSPNWGQPPGMLPRETAPVNAGTAMSTATARGRGRESPSAEPHMSVGGYQVYYDLRSETRLRAWREQGITELYMPLPGTRQYMVCALEIALRQGSGECRLIEPDDPSLATLGDAREVINMQRVYRRGEAVWRGPGPYR